MFLSRIISNSQRPVDYYQLHKDLWRFFPDYKKSNLCSPAPFFFRIENLHSKGRKIILMQSSVKPIKINNSNDSKIFYGSHLLLQNTKSMDHLWDSLKVGQELKFIVRAYPSKRLKKDGKTSNHGNVRVPLIKEPLILEWLKARLEKEKYISVENCKTISRFHLRFRKKKNNNSKHEYHFGSIYTVTYTGYLKVQQPKEFIKNIMLKGVGPAKAFGCGLLSIAKP